MLAPEVRAELRSLSRHQADSVARHLVAAGQLVDTEPELALQHAREARRMAARIGAVREAVGITAYHAGEWAEALTELRAARRLTGDPSHLALMADCERAMGRPERALRVAQSPEAGQLDAAGRVELRIVEAGARRDLGELDAALMILRGAGLDRSRLLPWSVRLWYAYADMLVAAGRLDEAREWFIAVAGVDGDGQTDADDRLVELGVLEPIDHGDRHQEAEPDPVDTGPGQADPDPGGVGPGGAGPVDGGDSGAGADPARAAAVDAGDARAGADPAGEASADAGRRRAGADPGGVGPGGAGPVGGGDARPGADSAGAAAVDAGDARASADPAGEAPVNAGHGPTDADPGGVGPAGEAPVEAGDGSADAVAGADRDGTTAQPRSEPARGPALFREPHTEPPSSVS